MSSRPQPTLHDRLALLYMKLAKGRTAGFEGQSREYYEDYFASDHVARYKSDITILLRRREILSALSALPDHACIVDVGCGVGDVLRDATRRWHGVGLELSFQSLVLARGMAPMAAFVNGSIYSLPFRDNSVDAVVCLEVLEHLEDDLAAAREIRRVLRPGGLLVVSVPGVYYFPEYLALTGHYRHYTSESLDQLLTSAGLHVRRWLQHYPRLNALYLYVYASFVASNMLLRKLFRDRTTFYERRLPFLRVRPYGLISRLLLEPIARLESRVPPQHASSATFCVAERPTDLATG